ncbi:receptor-like protein 7 [Senna tora]|uniref:Receptor-like protein 7 n=1 Tax=Senna tora TaxID=362788 RepID=A0A834WJI5_9FABA|nr:receptor-like protein 7 [Senna tora]
MCLCDHVFVVSGFCLEDQQSLLLQLKNELKFHSEESTKLVSWNPLLPCCKWRGVTCDDEGHVAGLDLSDEFIYGGLDNSSALFSLTYLQNLSLWGNDFNSPIPPAIKNLKNLISLDLSDAYFVGDIPIEISQLTRDYKSTKAFTNLTGIRILRLDGIWISAQAQEWSNALLALPGLEELSMRYCDLSGPIESSLAKLENLSIIVLDGINLLSTVPETFANLKHMTKLSLSNCGLRGMFPQKIFQIQTLSFVDISDNYDLRGSLPDLPLSGSLETLKWEIPSSLFALSSLKEIYLSYNDFDGQMDEFSISSSSTLNVLDLSNNHLEGPIPLSVFKLSELQVLQLSSNKFTGIVKLDMIRSLRNLTTLHMSYNNLLVDLNTSLDANFSNILPNLDTLNLASCKLKGFPMLERSKFLTNLDLSNNEIEGLIPNWIWKLENIYYLNLSCNFLRGFEGSLLNLTARFDVLDLHSNQLQGQIPIFSSGSFITYLDYSNNNFNSLIPSNCTLDLHGNQLSGPIPKSLSNCTELEALDLGNNQINGGFPCWLKKIKLRVMILRANNFQGSVKCLDDNATWPLLQIVDLAFNKFSGLLPTKVFTTMEAMINVEDQVSSVLRQLFQLKWMLSPPASKNHHGIDLKLITGIEFGVVFGLGIVIGPLFLWKQWRIRYWKCVDNILCSIFPQLYLDYQRRDGRTYTVLRWRH